MRHRRGNMLIMMTVVMVPLVGFVSLGVDLGRVQVAKGELQTAADAAARNGASYLTQSSALAQSGAVATAAMNTSDGSPVVLVAATDVIVGTWNSGTSTFSAGGASPNALKVYARRTGALGNAVPHIFAQIYGMKTCDVTVSSIAMLSTAAGASSTSLRVDGSMNPWLAGMPNGNYGGSAVSGTAPANSPTQVAMTIMPGQTLQFTVSGSMADDPVNINQNWTPDGQPAGNRTNDSGYLNGMSQLVTQQGSLVGVFLDNNAPNSGGATPAALDMASPASRDFTTLSPALRQPFFIGDAKTSGAVQQQFVVPAGATRLFLGMMDNVNWANNSGFFWVSVNGPAPKISTVK